MGDIHRTSSLALYSRLLAPGPLLIIGFMEKILYNAMINFGGIDVRSER